MQMFNISTLQMLSYSHSSKFLLGRGAPDTDLSPERADRGVFWGRSAWDGLLCHLDEVDFCSQGEAPRRPFSAEGEWGRYNLNILFAPTSLWR